MEGGRESWIRPQTVLLNVEKDSRSNDHIFVRADRRDTEQLRLSL